MNTIVYKGKTFELDEEGYLMDFELWDEDVAQTLAEKEGIEKLTNDKIDILRFIREHYKKYNYFPILHTICRNVHQPRDCVNEEFINPLVAWKIAGLPKPDETLAHIIEHGESPT